MIICFHPAKKDCPDGWSPTADSCLKASSIAKTWIEAVKECQKTPNAQLAFDFSEQEKEYIRLKLPFGVNYFVGIRNRYY